MTSSTRSPLVVVSGPTATGKSLLGVQVAELLSGEIVNGDSVQLYQDHSIGANLPPEDLIQRVPHHLLGVLSPDEPTNVAQYCEQFSKLEKSLRERAIPPVLVGGSTLYISSLIEGLSELPAADHAFRAETDLRSAESLWNELQMVDPLRAAALHPNDRLRVVRALEVARGVGRSQTAGEPWPAAVLILVLLLSRTELYQLIEERSRVMVEAGLLEESRRLWSAYGEGWVARKAIGYAQALEVLQGEKPETELVESISVATRRYAKRQMTFWRNVKRRFDWNVLPGESSHETVRLGGERSGDTPRRNDLKDSICFHWDFLTLSQRLQNWRKSGPTGVEVWFLDASSVLAP